MSAMVRTKWEQYSIDAERRQEMLRAGRGGAFQNGDAFLRSCRLKSGASGLGPGDGEMPLHKTRRPESNSFGRGLAGRLNAGAVSSRRDERVARPSRALVVRLDDVPGDGLRILGPA